MEKPKATPLLIVESIGLSICLALGFGAAFYAGYNSMPYVLAPAILMDVACATCLNLHSRYMRGVLFTGDSTTNLKGCFWFGIVLFILSIISSFFFAITGFGKVGDIVYVKYGLYVALIPSFLSVLWSAVLIYESKNYMKISQGNYQGGKQFNMFP